MSKFSLLQERAPEPAKKEGDKDDKKKPETKEKPEAAQQTEKPPPITVAEVQHYLRVATQEGGGSQSGKSTPRSISEAGSRQPSLDAPPDSGAFSLGALKEQASGFFGGAPTASSG